MTEILVNYHVQNDKDKSENSYFVQVGQGNAIILENIIENFPPLNYKLHEDKGYHFRFYDQIANNVHCWVDIKNLKAKIPIINRTVKMKVLITPQINSSKVFEKFMEKNIKTEAVKKPIPQQSPDRRSGGRRRSSLSYDFSDDFNPRLDVHQHNKEEDNKRPKSMNKAPNDQDSLPGILEGSPLRLDKIDSKKAPIGLEAKILAEHQNYGNVITNQDYPKNNLNNFGMGHDLTNPIGHEYQDNYPRNDMNQKGNPDIMNYGNNFDNTNYQKKQKDKNTNNLKNTTPKKKYKRMIMN